MNCVKGEIHNVLSMMRVNARWASADRFTQEIPAATQSPLMRAFKQLHAELQWVPDLADVDTVTYLLPFLLVVESDKTSGLITGAAIASLNKFLLYGLITSDSPRADVAINRIAVGVARCRFEETHRVDDEAVLLKLLELVEYCLRSDAGPLITGENAWKMLQLCYSISTQPRASLHLRRAAENTLAHAILTVFDRIDRLLATESSPAKRKKAQQSKRGYGVALLEQVLQFLASLIAPATQDDATRVLGLRLINIVLETAGAALSHHPRLVAVLQADLSKFLLQNSETEDLAILSLTLRVVFNLFNSIKDHLKVQLEVFFTSVHMRIIESPSCADEQKELALESLLEFCREPAMMLDLYVNYDCDVHCTNLFEGLCKALAKHAHARDSLNALTLLCLEGLLAVVESIARRCPLPSSSSSSSSSSSARTLTGDALARAVTDTSPPNPLASRSASTDSALDVTSSVSDLMQLVMHADSDSDDASDATQLAWLHVARERTAEVLQQRKRTKKRYALAAEKFNAGHKAWLAYAQELELLPETLTPDAVAAFLLHTPGLNKTLIGDYLGEGPEDKHPFHAAVRDAYLSLLDFRSAPSLDDALRVFLAKFRLPGEAQKIDRMMEAFSREFFAQCGAQTPLADATAAFVVAFSVIMLNTDLHSDHVAKKMSVDEYVRNLRGINGGQDLPAAYLQTVYRNIQEREIQMQPDVADMETSSSVDRYSTAWDGVLKRSENVVGASFTSNASVLQLRAGLYEREMFLLIGESAIASLSLALDKSCDHANMEKALDGLKNCAVIALYFGMDELFNKIMGALSTYFLAFAHGILNGEKVFVPPSAAKGTKGGAATSSSSTQRRSRGGSVSGAEEEVDQRPASGDEQVEEEDEGEEEGEEDEEEEEEEVAAAVVSPRSRALADALAEDGLRGAKLRRALLSLKLLFQFVATQHEAFRKAWASVVECVLMFNELDVVPVSLVEMDEFVDARGVPLPPIHNSAGGGAAAAVPSPSSSSSSSTTSSSSAAGKSRERSRRMAERQAAIRSRIKSGVHSSAAASSSSSSPASGGGGPPSSGSLWGSLSSYLWADEDRAVDENFALVSRVLRDEVAKLGGGLLEREHWLRLVRRLSAGSLAALLDTLLSVRDPFKGLLVPSDAMLHENALLALELSVDLLLANASRLAPLWPKFHAYAAKMLQPQLPAPLHALAERVVVHLLRVGVRLFHDASVRPALTQSLSLLLRLDDAMYQALSDRLALGLTMLLRANVVYLGSEDSEAWGVLMALLLHLVQFKAARAACWDAVSLLADGGHVGPHNVRLWTRACVRLVDQRTPFAVDALRLLQPRVRVDELDGLRAMLRFVGDDRAPIAKTAWECLYSALLQPTAAVEEDAAAWQRCFHEVLFPFDDQDGDSLHSVALLAKTFLHHLAALLELDEFNALWLGVLRRLARKLRVAGPHAAASTHAATLFETTLQALYNLLLVLQAERVLARPCTIVDEGSPSPRMGTLFEATYAVVDEVVPHMKEQLGLVPSEEASGGEDEEVVAKHLAEEREEEEEEGSVPRGEEPVPSTPRVLQTVVIADGTIGVKVDEIIIDEITEAV